MDSSIRRALVNGGTVPLNELEPEDWLTIINRIMDRIESLTRHMHLHMSSNEHIAALCRELNSDLTSTVHAGAKSRKGRQLRIEILGTVAFEDWDRVFVALDVNGSLRVIRVSKRDHIYFSGTPSGEYIIVLLAASELDCHGRNLLGMEIVGNLMSVVSAAERLKAKHAQVMADANSDVRQIVMTAIAWPQ